MGSTAQPELPTGWARPGLQANPLSCALWKDGLGPGLTPCRALEGQSKAAAQLTVGVHSYDEVVAHGPCLAQLVRVAVVHHVIAVENTGW